MGSRLDFSIDAPYELADARLPPMLLLPLADAALRLGLEPLPHGGRIVIRACRVSGRLRITLSDTGIDYRSALESDAAWAAVRERIIALYAGEATLSLGPGALRENVTTIDVPYELSGASQGRTVMADAPAVLR
jgi:LytS/YehU family sensor histidine kinase